MQRKMELQEIYELHSEQVYRYIFFLLREKELAEDLTQDVFIKVYRNLEQFNDHSSLTTWIMKIARNLTYDYLRRKKIISFFHLENDSSLPSMTDTPEELFVAKENVQHLYHSIEKLKKEYQEVLVLRKINDYSIKETAIILGWSENKVKSKMARAIEKLRSEMLKQEGNYDEQSRRV